MRNSKTFPILIMILVLVLVAAATAYCQEAPRVGIAAETVIFSDHKETYRDANGNATAEYDYRLAPITGQIGMQVSDGLSILTRITYARAYSIQDPPSWAFSPNSAGTLFEFEGALAYHLSEAGFVRGGYSYMNFERTLNVYYGGGYRGTNVQTRHVAPFVGAGFNLDDTFIVKASFDYYPIISVSDSYSPYANSSGTSNNGYRAEAKVGYRFTDHMAVIGGIDLKKTKTRDGADGADSSQTFRKRQFLAGLQFYF
jgi:hypothetical protein